MRSTPTRHSNSSTASFTGYARTVTTRVCSGECELLSRLRRPRFRCLCDGSH